MSNSNSSKQILLSVIGIAILVVAVIGVSFAFFNYTRTGSVNTIRTGTITFNSTNSVINITNVFPVDKADIDTDVNNVGTGTVTITGSTNYNKGIDFVVTAEDVSENIGTTTGKLALSVAVSAEDLDDVTAFGSNSGTMTLNTFEDGNTISSGAVLASGRIPAETEIDGTITIKAYIDASSVAITDTYPAVVHYTRNSSMTAAELSSCEEHTVMATGFTGAETPSAFCDGTGTRGGKTFQEHLDEDLFSTGVLVDFLDANVIKELDAEGRTTSSWVHGRTVLSTSAWNALASTPASFKIRVEANQGS